MEAASARPAKKASHQMLYLSTADPKGLPGGRHTLPRVCLLRFERPQYSIEPALGATRLTTPKTFGTAGLRLDWAEASAQMLRPQTALHIKSSLPDSANQNGRRPSWESGL